MTAKKSNAGRPTLYNRSMIDKAKEYIWFFQLSEEDRATQEDSKINPVEVIPTVAGLALYLGVSKRVLYDWRDANEEFLHTLESLQDTQETLLLNNGLTGKFTAPITKLALSNHGYSEKQEMDVKTNGESLNKPTIINLVGKTN